MSNAYYFQFVYSQTSNSVMLTHPPCTHSPPCPWHAPCALPEVGLLRC